MIDTIPDFTDSEHWVVQTTLRERYGRKVDLAEVETEMRLSPYSTELTPCPGLYWKDKDCSFIVVKVGEKRFRGQFFYRVHQQYGTGKSEYDDLGDCVISLLQVQADHEAKKNKETSG
jgi:hypothetical protein